MNEVSSIGKFLEPLSEAYAHIPFEGYGIAGILSIVLLAFYGMVISRLKIAERRKILVRRVCAWCVIVLYSGTVLICNSFYGLLFLPVGILFAWQCIGKKMIFKAAGAAVMLSLCTQTVQMVLLEGMFDIRHFLLNIPWTLIGAASVLLWRLLAKKNKPVRYIIRGIMILLALILLAGICAFGVYHVLRVSGKLNAKDNISEVENRIQTDDSGLIWYNGKAYQYNENVITILVMGIDQNSEEIQQIEGISGESGQADSIFLLVMDESKNKVRIIGMSRDTMTPIKTFDYKGNYVGDAENHLGLAYAFGDGKETSCQYMVDAVSNLFYGIPINSYVALNMEAVEQLNDAVGGVAVTIPEDLAQMMPNQFSAGSTVTLNGKQALSFVRSRDTAIDFSNNLRMARQKTYLLNFAQTAIEKMKSDMGLPARLYHELSGKMVTDIDLNDAVYLATKGLSMSFSEDDIVTLQADAQRGTVYDEMYVDDQALYELILNTFYNEVSAGEDTE